MRCSCVSTTPNRAPAPVHSHKALHRWRPSRTNIEHHRAGASTACPHGGAIRGGAGGDRVRAVAAGRRRPGRCAGSAECGHAGAVRERGARGGAADVAGRTASSSWLATTATLDFIIGKPGRPSRRRSSPTLEVSEPSRAAGIAPWPRPATTASCAAGTCARARSLYTSTTDTSTRAARSRGGTPRTRSRRAAAIAPLGYGTGALPAPPRWHVR